MTVQRLTTIKQRENIKKLKKFKGYQIKDLSNQEKDELLEIIAKKLGYL